MSDALRHGRAVAAVALGAAAPLAFAPYDLWALVPLCCAALLAVLGGQPPRRAAWLGWCFGLGLFGHGVWWIQVSVHQFGLPYYLFSVSVTTLFVAYLALYPALFAWSLSRLDGGSAAGLALLVPALWVLSEWLRGTLLTGFPWLALGYTQLDGPLAGYAPVVGVPGLSALLLFGAALPLALVRGGWHARLGLSGAAAMLLIAAAILGDREWTVADGPARGAALVQGAVPQALKWQADQRTRALELYGRLTEPLWGTPVVVWPETALPAFPHEIPDTLALLAERSAASGTDLLLGMPTGEPWNGRYFNSVVDLGQSPGRYDKRHLVPFGEFFPFKDALEGVARLLSIPLSDFTAGAIAQPLLHAGGSAAGVSICYEDVYAREIARALPSAHFLVNVSNDAWFGDTIAPHQHLQIARMRALESGRDLLRATNTGISAVIDARGQVRARAPQFVATVVRGEFTPRRGATPYTRLGDGPLLAAAGAVVLVAAWRQRRRAALRSRSDPR